MSKYLWLLIPISSLFLLFYVLIVVLDNFVFTEWWGVPVLSFIAVFTGITFGAAVNKIRGER